VTLYKLLFRNVWKHAGFNEKEKMIEETLLIFKKNKNNFFHKQI